MADELRQLVGARRRELGLSYLALAAAGVDAGKSVSTGWLHRLESGAPVIAPSPEVLAAVAVGLRLDREASGEAGEVLAALAVLPDDQRRALVDLIRVIAEGR